MEQVAFRAMKDGAREEYEFLGGVEEEWAAGQAGRVLEAMTLLDGALGGYRVSRLTHCLQTATRAERDGADDEMVFAALIHDIGDVLAPRNHAAIAVAIMRPYVREEVTWVTAKHGVFQEYYYGHHVGRDRNAREAHRGHRWFDSCAGFCEYWDQAAFDPDYDTRPLAHFAPLVEDILSRPAWQAASPDVHGGTAGLAAP